MGLSANKALQATAASAVQDDGNVALYAEGGQFAGWATNTGQTLNAHHIPFHPFLPSILWHSAGKGQHVSDL